MTEFLQAAALVLVAAGAWAVVTTREIASQAVVVSLYGLIMAVLFFVYQAPDVALSQLVVGAVALPLVMLLAMAQVRKTQLKKKHERER
jgi:energy-converting hydrogenase B subunit D